jgi:ribosomal protein S8E
VHGADRAPDHLGDRPHGFAGCTELAHLLRGLLVVPAVPARPAHTREIEILDSRRFGGAWLLEQLWGRLGVGAALHRVAAERRLVSRVCTVGERFQVRMLSGPSTPGRISTIVLMVAGSAAPSMIKAVRSSRRAQRAHCPSRVDLAFGVTGAAAVVLGDSRAGEAYRSGIGAFGTPRQQAVVSAEWADAACAHCGIEAAVGSSPGQDGVRF